MGSSWAFSKGISDNFWGEIGGKPELPEIYLEYALWKLTHTKAPVQLEGSAILKMWNPTCHIYNNTQIYLKCLPWKLILVKFDQNWSVHEAK